jgi:hypothetical protein
VVQGPSQDCWSAYIFFSQIHYFMVIFHNFMVGTDQCRPAGAEHWWLANAPTRAQEGLRK